MASTERLVRRATYAAILRRSQPHLARVRRSRRGQINIARFVKAHASTAERLFEAGAGVVIAENPLPRRGPSDGCRETSLCGSASRVQAANACAGTKNALPKDRSGRRTPARGTSTSRPPQVKRSQSDPHETRSPHSRHRANEPHTMNGRWRVRSPLGAHGAGRDPRDHARPCSGLRGRTLNGAVPSVPCARALR